MGCGAMKAFKRALLLAGVVVAMLGRPTVTMAQAADNPAHKLAFGSAQPAEGFTRVDANLLYNKETGYGFEAGAKVQANERGITADAPFYFSAAVPEGNYKVTVTLGDSVGESTTTVKAELRRLMLERVHTSAGQFEKRTFIVNVRTPRITDDLKVKLKEPRETRDEAWAWDERITLEFNGKRPSVSAIEIERALVPTVFLLGDSTVCDQSGEPYASWGQMFPRFFKPDVAIANHAESGESLASSTGARRIDKVLSLMKTGDYLFVQFGHNDMKSKAPDAVAQYKASLKRWVAQVKEKGGTAVLVTPMNRHRFTNGVVTNSLQEYPQMVREAAKEEGVAMIDLNAMSKSLYEALGERPSVHLFKHVGSDLTKFDATHHSPYGAYELARCVVEGIKQNKLELAGHLSDDAAKVTFDPSKPDALETIDLPASPGISKERPLGD